MCKTRVRVILKIFSECVRRMEFSFKQLNAFSLNQIVLHIVDTYVKLLSVLLSDFCTKREKRVQKMLNKRRIFGIIRNKNSRKTKPK